MSQGAVYLLSCLHPVSGRISLDTHEIIISLSMDGRASPVTVLVKGIVMRLTHLLFVLWMTIGGICAVSAQVAGKSGRNDLTVVTNGQTRAVIVVSPGLDQRTWEYRAATDLARYIELMTGVKPVLVETAPAGDLPAFFIGSAALKAKPVLRGRLDKVAKKNPTVRADAIVVQRDGNRIYLAGLTDENQYHAVSHLLHAWGCRWYLPTEFGECVPEYKTLSIGEYDVAYASPFEIRDGRPLSVMAWLGSSKGWADFGARNFKTVDISGYGGPDPDRGIPNVGHSLGEYLKDILPEGKNIFNAPISDENVIDHVAAKVEARYRDGKNIDLGINDGAYSPSGSARDKQLQAGLYDKYFVNVSMSDVFLTLYNGVADRLKAKYPQSPSKIAFFIYTNLTIPPQQVEKAADNLVGVLAPIDIDPTHGMDDLHSPPKQEYRDMMYRWAEVMSGRVYVYDYDQGMLVWRDMPNPSHQAFRQDVKHYRKAGILGFTTESRGAYATIFLNMYFRAQLMWNPDFDVDAALAEFYPKFYGPATEPMRRYWTALYKAWEEMFATEHEFFAAPAIYTDALIEQLRPEVVAAEKTVEPLTRRNDLSRNEKLYLERVRFTRHSFDVIDNYMGMVRAGARNGDYAKGSSLGKQGLAARQRLGDMNEIFISTKMGEDDPAWFVGEVKMYEELAKLTDGTKGTLVAKLPLEWSFLRDPNDAGLPHGIARKPADLTYWKAHGSELTGFARRAYPPMTWEMVNTDLYPQAQGILHPDGQAFTGYSWYKTTLDLNANQVNGQVHLHFPGLFAKAWLYVNGRLVKFREQQDMWWWNDYRFAWDVDVTGYLKAGQNDITLRNWNNHHVSGLFRRPFLYRPVK